MAPVAAAGHARAQARFWARAARATAQAPKFKGPQKYNVYTKYSYIVGFILVVNWPNRKQTVPQIYHRRENVDPIRTPLGPFRFPAVTARRGPTRVATQACRDVCTSHQVPPRRRRRH